MPGSQEGTMNGSNHGKWYRRRSYLGYSIGCAVTWAIIWVLLAALAGPTTIHRIGYMFMGWVIGWVSASIARVFYPAPRSTVITREREA
jgi:hypothetical protein